jgi:6-pyruvoyltetrahydropterin/6-carboxytetrahydropterin synthase
MTETWDIEVDFEFQAARRLTRLPPEHPCGRLHGHSFHCTLRVTAPLDPGPEWAVDFGVVQAAADALCQALEHQHLNELEGLSNPTSERLAQWMWARTVAHLPGLSAIVISETSRTRCIYRGPRPAEREGS